MKKIFGGISSLFSLYRGLPRSIYFLFFSNVVNSAGSFVFPFLTFYLTDRLGYSPARAGTLLFWATISLIPGSIIGGKAADCFGRKRVLMVSQFLSAAALIPCAFLGISPVVPWLIVVGRISSSVHRVPRARR